LKILGQIISEKAFKIIESAEGSLSKPVRYEFLSNDVQNTDNAMCGAQRHITSILSRLC